MSMLYRACLASLLAAFPAAAQTPPRPAPAPQPAPAPAPAAVAPAPAPAPRARPAPLVDVDRRELERQLRDAQWEMERAAPLAREAMERSLLEMTRAVERLDVAELARVAEHAMGPLMAEVPRLVDESMVRAREAMHDAERMAMLAPAAEEVRAQVEAALVDAARPARSATAPRLRSTPPAPWAAQDPADSLYRVGREALNRSDYRRAASLFRQLAERYPRSAYAADAAYWEAFARYRLRTEPELRQALRVLEARLARNVSSSTSADAAALAARIRGELASWNHADAARQRAELQQAARTGDGCDREDAAVRIEALNALAKIDSTAVLSSVRRVLANQAPCAASLRENAVLILGRSRSPEAEGLLVQTARADASPSVRGAALAWLARSSSDRALDAIEQILRESPDERTQSAAVAALAHSGSPRARQTLRALAERADASVRMRSSAISEMGRDTSAATAAYLRSLYGRLDSLRLKESVIAGVARNRSVESGQWLASIARNGSEPVRLRRAALGHYSARADVSVAELGRVYDATPEWELRETIIGTLTRRKEPEATDKLLAIARSDDNPRLRRAAIGALTRKDDPRTAKLLLDIIDKNP